MSNAVSMMLNLLLPYESNNESNCRVDDSFPSTPAVSLEMVVAVVVVVDDVTFVSVGFEEISSMHAAAVVTPLRNSASLDEEDIGDPKRSVCSDSFTCCVYPRMDSSGGVSVTEPVESNVSSDIITGTVVALTAFDDDFFFLSFL